MNFSLPTYKKIGLVYGILVILLVVALGVRFFAGNKPQNTSGGNITNTQVKKNTNLSGKVSLAADKISYRVGENIEVAILYAAPGKKLDGIDVVLRYDPRIVSVLGFTEGNTFKIYPRKDIDNKEGSVTVTALDSTSVEALPQNKLALGKLQLLAQKAGTAQINFDFTTGGTNKTTLIEAASSQNILGEATGVTIRVE